MIRCNTNFDTIDISLCLGFPDVFLVELSQNILASRWALLFVSSSAVASSWTSLLLLTAVSVP